MSNTASKDTLKLLICNEQQTERQAISCAKSVFTLYKDFIYHEGEVHCTMKTNNDENCEVFDPTSAQDLNALARRLADPKLFNALKELRSHYKDEGFTNQVRDSIKNAQSLLKTNFLEALHQLLFIKTNLKCPVNGYLLNTSNHPFQGSYVLLDTLEEITVCFEHLRETLALMGYQIQSPVCDSVIH